MLEKRNGTIRGNRLLEELLYSPFQIDQRSFWDIMGYISAFLKEINYYDLEDTIDGDWSQLLQNDPIIYMVSIINEPLTQLNQISYNYSGAELLNKDQNMIIDSLFKWYGKIESWSTNLSDLGEVQLSNKIKNVVVDVLYYQFQSLQDIKSVLENVDIDNANDVKAAFDSIPIPQRKKKVNLSKVVHSFQKCIMHIQEFTKKYLEESILSRNSHQPHDAMYIAFAILFKTLQKNINTLSRRHLDFYYKDILQQKQYKGAPTKTVVNFDLLPTKKYSLIAGDTKLSAGNQFGSQNEVLFKTVKPLVAYQLKLAELKTLLFMKSPLIQVGTDAPLVSSISVSTLLNKGKDVADKEEWFAFGANKRSISNTQIDSDKTGAMGFIIGSPVLLLSEGQRSIDLQINMETSTSKDVFWKLMNQIKESRDIEMNTVFSYVFDGALRISYSSKKGWEPVDKYAITFDESNDYFNINIVLNTAAPALEASKKLDVALSWPSIKIELNECAPVFLYSFFNGLIIDTIDINVDVQRVRGLSMFNTNGKVTNGSTFEMFGTMPKTGSYLMIGKSELFQKQVNNLSLDIDWENLPDDFGGFDTYYQGYSKEITNASFEVQFETLSNSYWLPTQKKFAPKYQLFSLEDCLTPEGYKSAKLKSSTSLNLDKFKDFETSKDYDLVDPLNYTVETQSGFIKLTLTSPREAFGDELYQEDLVAIATYNAENKTKIPNPNKPFVLKANEIKLNYKASDTLVFNEALATSNSHGDNIGEFKHITPFGIEDVIVDQHVLGQNLVSNYSQEGYLYLGIEGVDELITASIYFNLLQSSSGINIQKGNLLWECFDGSKWKPFDEGAVILDNTHGFSKSGIVELILDNYPNNSDPSKAGLCWIRVSTKNNAHIYPKIKGIYMNAVEAICLSEEEIVMGKNIPEGSINKFVAKHPDVKKVNQPVHSYGGKLEETQEQMYARVSERLRHKSRAVSIWDYERLILDNFKKVKVVKCTNFNKDFKSVPGEVKVIVLSESWTKEERHYFNEGELDEMQQFLEKVSSPFAKIHVMNASVEYLLVNCLVKFKPEDNGGYYLTKLNDDISEYLSPISNIDQGVGGVGGSVVPTMLVSFIESLPYVLRVDDLNIEHIIRKDETHYTVDVKRGDQKIETTTPWGMLSPVDLHHIVSTESTGGVMEVGVGNMEIGSDLIIGCETTQMKGLSSANKPDNNIKDAILVFNNKMSEDER